MSEVRRRLREDHPFAMLAEASAIYSVLDPRSRDPFEVEPSSTRDRDEVITSFLNVDLPETSALLHVIAELTDDELMRARILRELSSRAHLLPYWITDLGSVVPYGPIEMRHVLQDGDEIMIGAHLPGGDEITIIVYIDHNLGTVVKDGFVVPEALDAVVRFSKEKQGDDPDISWNEISPADARVRITEAIATGAMIIQPFKTDSWPASRPLVEWIVRLLPEGGRGYERHEWDEAEREELATRFLDSSFGTPLRDDPDIPDLLETLLWYGCDYGPGDPLHWSPVAVEIFLTSWLPRKVDAPVDYLDKAPDLLRAFIRFAYHERGIRDSLTLETLGAVDRWEVEFNEAIRSDRPMGPMAILDAMGVLDREGTDDRITAGGGGPVRTRHHRRRTKGEVPPDIDKIVAGSVVMARFQLLSDFYGEGRKLTKTGNPTLADSRSLIALLGTDDRMDETIGDRTFKTTSAVELPELMFTLRWAVAAGVLRKEHGKLRATALWRRTRKPGQRWIRAVDALPKLGPLETFFAHARYRGTHEIVDEVFDQILGVLLAGAIDWDDILDIVCGYAEEYFEWGPGYMDDPDFRRGMFDHDLDLLATILGWAGLVDRVGAATEPHDLYPDQEQLVGGTLQLTDPGGWWVGSSG